MQFSPNNPIVKYCLQALNMEEGNPEGAINLYIQAWDEASYDFEKFIAAYHIARCQRNSSEKLLWFERALEIAININDDSVKSAFPVLYASIAKCHEALGNVDLAVANIEQASSLNVTPIDKGPFYHGTKAELQIGDYLTAGIKSNYNSDIIMNHVYFTAIISGAGLAAALAKGNGRERVYIVEPTGDFEDDPNVTNKKFPGNPTRSYRSTAPLKIVGEIKESQRSI